MLFFVLAAIRYWQLQKHRATVSQDLAAFYQTPSVESEEKLSKNA